MLLETVKTDVINFLKENEELFFNERDFQMHLAVYLRQTDKYDDVDVEYYVPCEQLDGYVWNSELRLDIVVRKDDEYVPVELKYKTRKVEKSLPRFNETVDNIVVMKNQLAQDLGRYDFWKDVRRIELVRNRFRRVVGGLAVFLTNDKSYLNSPRETSADHLLSMSEGTHQCNKKWGENAKSISQSRPSFEVEKEYPIEWNAIKRYDVDLHYCIVVVEYLCNIVF